MAGPRRKCGHPRCDFLVHSDPQVTLFYCCRYCLDSHVQHEAPRHGRQCESNVAHRDGSAYDDDPCEIRQSRFLPDQHLGRDRYSAASHKKTAPHGRLAPVLAELPARWDSKQQKAIAGQPGQSSVRHQVTPHVKDAMLRRQRQLRRN